jgi:hypothetical protein
LEIDDTTAATDPNLILAAEQDGSITAVSAAGTFQTPDEDLSKNTSNSLNYWIILTTCRTLEISVLN